MKTPLTTEENLLITMLRRSDSGYGNFDFADISWPDFLELANNHRVVPIIYECLQDSSYDFPTEAIDLCRPLAERISQQNLRFSVELGTLADLFRHNNVPAIFYKGPVLAVLTHTDFGLRQFGDLDLLILKKDFQEVKNLILQIGGSPHWKPEQKPEAAVLKYYYEYPFRIGEPPVLLEVHWEFMESFFGFDYNVEDCFARAIEIEFNGHPVSTLSNEDTLIVLCVHGSKHYWKRLSWIYDIGKLVESQEISWDIVIRFATKHGCLRMLLLGLSLTNELFDFELPEKIRLYLDDDSVLKELSETLKQQIFDTEFSEESVQADLHLKMRERWRDKFRYSQRLFRTRLIDSLFMPMGRPR